MNVFSVRPRIRMFKYLPFTIGKFQRPVLLKYLLRQQKFLKRKFEINTSRTHREILRSISTKSQTKFRSEASGTRSRRERA
ncbi:hypothetical protein BpHYR1_008523 [Brachionus plicatilis]|uniref:Uncharacterized protein n=1 Tax=Brachionus plicatilis TaxID=10195 RepID=A0A3M7T5A2_BRAPC|nr:hypothetical protein BpHYR1_008523 [Brachionus plicatilis]